MGLFSWRQLIFLVGAPVGSIARIMKIMSFRLLRLLDCRMVVTVVMDGSFENAKKSTLFSRSRDQARTSVSCSPNTQHKNVVLPMFAKGTHIWAASQPQIDSVTKKLIRVEKQVILSCSSDILNLPNGKLMCQYGIVTFTLGLEGELCS